MPDSSRTSKRHALLYFTHVFNERHLKKFRELRDAFARYGDAFTLHFSEHGDLNAPPEFNAHGTDRRALNALNYPWMHNRLMPGHTHYPLMHFAQCHPDYDSYTVIEYDVELTGSWTVFLASCMGDGADFLATHIADQKEHPAWFFWDTLVLPAGREESAPAFRKIRSFGPIYKVSTRALQVVHAAYQAGASGHFECLIPSLVFDNGLTIRDINELPHPAARKTERWYTKPPGDRAGTLERSSMRFRPNRLFPGRRSDTLYHPVKFGKGERLDHLRRKLTGLFKR